MIKNNKEDIECVLAMVSVVILAIGVMAFAIARI